MGSHSKIEWTEATWNPVTGCSKVSQGCKNCYAETFANRRLGDFLDGRKFTDVRCHEDRLELPLHWRKPRRIFVNSMSDLFHEAVPDDFIDRVFAVMSLCPQHTFQILTKRPERMLAYSKKRENMFVDGAEKEILDFLHFVTKEKQNAAGWHTRVTRDEDDCADVDVQFSGKLPLQNVWLGVSCENQETAGERIPLLLKVPAAIRFVSCEPLLGPIDIQMAYSYRSFGKECSSCSGTGTYGDNFNTPCPECDQTGINPNPIDWVICGGESGPRARPMHPDWARSMRDQCQAAGVPFFFKQWGEWAPLAPFYNVDESFLSPIAEADENLYKIVVRDGTIYRKNETPPPKNSWMMERVGKRKAGNILDGKTWNEFPKLEGQ